MSEPVVRLLATERLLAANVVMAALALWFLNHPYGGVWGHDARIYSVMVLNRMMPEAYAGDPFFSFGSQDSRSAFSLLYAPLVLLLGLSRAALLMTAFSGFAWVYSLWRLASTVSLSTFARIFFVIGGGISTIVYAPNGGTFAVGESYATARLLAMAASLLAAAALLSEKQRKAWVWASISTALHPLLGVWSLGLCVLARRSDRQVLLIALAGAFLLLSAIACRWKPFAPIDGEWFEIIRASTVDVLVGNWGIARLDRFFFWLGALLIGARWGGGIFGRTCELTALVCAGSYLVAQLAGYVWPAELLIQLQLWRSVWLAVILGSMALIVVTARVLEQAPQLRLLTFLALMIGVQLGFYCGIVFVIMWIGLRGAVASRVLTVVRIASRFRLLWLMCGAASIIVLLPGYVLDLQMAGVGISGQLEGWAAALAGMLLGGGVGVGCMLSAALLANMRFAKVFVLPLIAGSILAAFHWSQQGALPQAWEQLIWSTGKASPLFVSIRRGDAVLWPQNVHRVWLELGTASYGSTIHATGMVFSRERTMEMKRRLTRLAVASELNEWPATATAVESALNRFRAKTGIPINQVGSLFSYDPDRVTSAGLRLLCGDTQLRWVISRKAYPEAAHALAEIRSDPYDGGELFLYDCARLATDAQD